jgi:4-hydroxybenzoate polyprenyltransferase
VCSNVIAGIALTGSRPDAVGLTIPLVSVSALYIAGMFLNDAFDASYDAAHRSSRPIPRGDVSVREVVLASAGLLVTALALLAWASPAGAIWGLLLAIAIVWYDVRHKGNAFGPILMGTCRGLVYCVAAAACGTVNSAVAGGAVVLAGYVIGLTVVARAIGPAGGGTVPRLIAGISLLDAAVILALSGRADLAAVAALGFPLTLLLQRFVPGD